MLQKYAFTFAFLLLIITAKAQFFPAQGVVFTDNEVPRIEILIHPDSLALIYDELENEHEYQATFIYQSSQVLHDTMLNIGFRLRGNTSLFSAKKSFKISFNTYVPGRKYHGLEKLNLNGEHNDPSIIRSKLCWDLFRQFGVPASRANHCRVYINGDYYGLYINVEHVDEEFVKSRFDNNNGNLYKCTWPADLQYLGADPDLYKYGSNPRAYELHTNTALDDYTDLAHFIDVLNNTADDSLQQKLDLNFNVQSYLKYLVIECLTGHWDAYSFNKNNYYLYHNLNTGKFEFMPYDLDNTFGIDWMNIDWGLRNIYNMAASDPRPLTRRILQNDLYRKEFSFYVNQFLRECFNTSQMFPSIDSTYNMIYGYATFDPYRSLDYGWTMQDFTDSYTQLLGDHVKYGLKPFIGTRYSSAMQQVEMQATPKLYINEFMASNNTTITDDFGEYEDWIEIYNGGNDPVWLGDKYLTDDLNNPSKWALPQLSLVAGAYLLLWADGSPSQGNRHTSFKLSAEGEHIGIFTSPANGSLPIDILTYGQQYPDIPEGLLPNGQGMMKPLLTPTPGSSNNINIGIEHDISSSQEALFYPNPFHDNLFLTLKRNIRAAEIKVTMYDALGRMVFETVIEADNFTQGQSISLNPGALNPGIYFISIVTKDNSGKMNYFPGQKLIRN